MTAVRALGILLGVIAFGGLVVASGASSPTVTVRVAFLQGEQVVYVERPGGTVRAALTALLAGPTAAERKREIDSDVLPGTPLLGTVVSSGTATVDLGERFVQGRDADRLSARLAQVVLTATSAPSVTRVRVLLKGGVPHGLFAGIDLTAPVTARDVRRPNVAPPYSREARARAAALAGRASAPGAPRRSRISLP